MGIVGLRAPSGRPDRRIADALGMRVIANDTYHGDDRRIEGFPLGEVSKSCCAESDV
jgi:hypothetical protein